MAGRILILCFFLFNTLAFSSLRDSTYTMINGEKVYKRVQFKPEYPGGMDSLLAFLDRHLIIPPGTEGATVTAVFIIDSHGKIHSIRIENSTDQRYSDEAVRVLGMMPLWKPASHLGKKVSCFFTMPITFEKRTGR